MKPPAINDNYTLRAKNFNIFSVPNRVFNQYNAKHAVYKFAIDNYRVQFNLYAPLRNKKRKRYA